MTYINIDGTRYAATVQARPSDASWDGRASRAITMKTTYAEAMELFRDGLVWSVISDDGETDMSAYALAGPVTDNRDGTITARMGRYRDAELMQTVLGGVPANRAGALKIRAVMETAVQSLGDADALAVRVLYPAWEELAQTGYVAQDAGFKFRHGEQLCKTVAPGTAFAAHWVPGEGTESLYTVIDDTHAGTQEDPIPYSGDMALVTGLHYSQDGVVYRCTRDSGNPVYHALRELVGLYVEEVEA